MSQPLSIPALNGGFLAEEQMMYTMISNDFLQRAHQLSAAVEDLMQQLTDLDADPDAPALDAQTQDAMHRTARALIEYHGQQALPLQEPTHA
jgi:hypothetical protein